MIDTRYPVRSLPKVDDGFSLIELSVILVILTLLLGAGIAALTAQLDSQRIAATKMKASAIQTALTSFLSRNYRLPCPADPTLASNSGNVSYGMEGTPSGTCNSPAGIVTSGVAPATVVTGMVPWKTLGLSEDAASDGYYNRFMYQVVVSATSLNSQNVSGMRGYIVLTSSAGGSQINDCSGGLTFDPCADVAVILSYGKDGYGAYTASGTQIAITGAGPDEAENFNNDNKFVVKDFSTSSSNPFDDIVLALTPNDLLSPLITQGALQNYNAVLNNNFAIIKGAVIAYATNNRSFTGLCIGSCPANTGCGIQCPLMNYPLPASMPTLPGSVTTDPWGNSISYTVVTNPVTASTPPANVAYTVSSRGPDGITSADDIVVNVFVGELQTMFAKSGM